MTFFLYAQAFCTIFFDEVRYLYRILTRMELIETIQASLPSAVCADGGPLLVALSGGADSVCLLLALREMGYTVEALHCNFQLRGVESDADEAFCRRLCRAHGIPLQVKHFRTQSHARRQGVSIEMAARQLRYDWFCQQARARQAQAVCVAHHRDDSIETLLLNLIRGTGIHGLTGMKSERRLADGTLLLRPLLALSRQDIEAWLQQRGQTWVTDSTNLSAEAAQRNRIRLQLLPLMEELNPRVRENLAETAARLSEAEALYTQAVEASRDRVMPQPDAIDVAALLASPAPRTMLHELLTPLGFTPDQAQDIFDHLDGEPGHLWLSPSHRLLRDRGRLLLQPVEEARSGGVDQVLPLEGLFETPDGQRLLVRRQAIAPGFQPPRDPSTVCMDLEKLQLPLRLRTAREGDRFQPFGMEGTRLISDLLTDRHLSLFQRERQLLVLSGESIAWVVGIRAAAGFEVDDSTRHVITITTLTR